MQMHSVRDEHLWCEEHQPTLQREETPEEYD
jgi:hypothetical protein